MIVSTNLIVIKLPHNTSPEELLDFYLEEAKAGEIDSVLMVVLMKDNRVVTRWSSFHSNLKALGLIEWLRQQFYNSEMGV